MDLEDVRARICAALETPEDDWLAHAVRVIEAHQNMRRRAKIFDISTIGKRVRTGRSLAGMGQRDLARRVSLPQQTISDIERDRRAIPLPKIAGIAMSLGVKVAWLLTGEGPGGPRTHGSVLRAAPTPKARKQAQKAAQIAAARELLRAERERRAQGEAKSSHEGLTHAVCVSDSSD